MLSYVVINFQCYYIKAMSHHMHDLVSHPPSVKRGLSVFVSRLAIQVAHIRFCWTAPLMKSSSLIIVVLVTLTDNLIGIQAAPPGQQGNEIGPIGGRWPTWPEPSCGCQGPPGETGIDGRPGLEGVPGSPGSAGRPGPRGEPGPSGQVGPRGGYGRPGYDGAPGSAGRPGEKGERGFSGPQGVPGPLGQVGPRGSYGQSGSPGEPGREGVPGQHGRPGEKGEQGRNGPSGPRGEPGPSGESGLRGDVGRSGRDGETGPTGLPGVKGERGSDGPLGIPGSPGTPGPPGRTGYPGQNGKTLMGMPGVPGHSGGGVTYTSWGKNNCSSDSETLYTGWAGGNRAGNHGGGSNLICATDKPAYHPESTTEDRNTTKLSSAEYKTESQIRSITHTNKQNANIPCAVCYVPIRSAQIMIPGTYICPSGWTTEYDGWLMAPHNAHNSQATFTCIAKWPDAISNSTNVHQGISLYHVEADCASGIKCGGDNYDGQKEMACVVCTK